MQWRPGYVVRIAAATDAKENQESKTQNDT